MGDTRTNHSQWAPPMDCVWRDGCKGKARKAIGVYPLCVFCWLKARCRICDDDKPETELAFATLEIRTEHHKVLEAEGFNKFPYSNVCVTHLGDYVSLIKYTNSKEYIPAVPQNVLAKLKEIHATGRRGLPSSRQNNARR